MSYVQVFERINKNKDGKISWDEFSQGIRAFSPTLTSEEINEMFKEFDVDGDGQIDIIEFAKCFVISASEIHVVLKRLRENKSMEECNNIVRAVDARQRWFC
ncbi:hypothetical protein N665_0002s0181 [Sinapis alba]|nr:hypothetical protein N665_0002s0181 [Sinapis alba]